MTVDPTVLPPSTEPGPEAPAPALPSPTPRLSTQLAPFRFLFRLTSTAGLLSYFAAGIMGAVATTLVGAPFAMGLAMYLGNTEPSTPHGAYPWGLAMLALGTEIIGLVLEYRLGRPKLGALLAHVGGIAFPLVAFLHIYRLWAAIR
jgi:hypothetical protein